MRTASPNQASWLCVEPTGAEQYTAACQPCADNDEQRNQRSNETRSGEATETFHREFLESAEECRVVERRAHVNESSGEECHADWNMDGVPESHQAARLR